MYRFCIFIKKIFNSYFFPIDKTLDLPLTPLSPKKSHRFDLAPRSYLNIESYFLFWIVVYHNMFLSHFHVRFFHADYVNDSGLPSGFIIRLSLNLSHYKSSLSRVRTMHPDLMVTLPPCLVNSFAFDRQFLS